MDIQIQGAKIVIADDTPISAKLLEMNLVKYGYEVFVAYDGIEALELINQVNPDIVILDIMMPRLSGLEVCEKIKNNEQTRFLPVIILTSSDERKDKNLALSIGVNDFLNKPFDPIELKLRVQSLLKFRYAIDELENVNNVLRALVRAVEAKDKYTEGHTERVSLYALKVARRLNLSERQIKDIRMAGVLHDIGKIGIPDSILNKEGKLTNAEYEIMKNHPVIGQQICSSIKAFDNVNKIIRHHHEKLNGTGYPDRIHGEDINIETRILAVVDIYDALTSDRPYRKALNPETGFEILKDAVSKGELDRQVVSTLESIINEEQNTINRT